MKEYVKAFVGGMLFTVILVIVVPVITTNYIQPVIVRHAGDIGVGIISSSMIISAILFLVTILFSLLFGGGAILRSFGVIGVLGLIFAYWLLGNIYGSIIPVATLILFAILKRIWDWYKNRGKDKEKKPKKEKKSKKEERKRQILLGSGLQKK